MNQTSTKLRNLLLFLTALIVAPLAISDETGAQPVPPLSSNPRAAITIMLDFDGHYVKGKWNPNYFAQDFAFPPFDLDGVADKFGVVEQIYIFEVWATVAEDFAPFDVNVTTVEPLEIAPVNLLRVNLSPEESRFFTDGKSGFNSFNDPWQPNLVFVKTRAEYESIKVGTTASHEIGHAIGLHHQIVANSDGVVIDDYHDGFADVGPTMGSSTGSTRKIWWSGDAADSYGNVFHQDDLATLSRSIEGFPYRSDDHSNSQSGATQLRPYSVGSTRNYGIIERTSDVDCFKFSSDTATVSFETIVDKVAPNLKVSMELWKVNSQHQQHWGRKAIEVIAKSGSVKLNAKIYKKISAGDYIIVVKSHGEYGDIGQYSLRGNGIKNSQFTPNIRRR